MACIGSVMYDCSSVYASVRRTYTEINKLLLNAHSVGIRLTFNTAQEISYMFKVLKHIDYNTRMLQYTLMDDEHTCTFPMYVTFVNTYQNKTMKKTNT
jgi:hypothetical protein